MEGEEPLHEGSIAKTSRRADGATGEPWQPSGSRNGIRGLDVGRVGATLEQEFTYGWQDVVHYALSIGAQADEYAYLHESHGPRVVPSFAVIPSYPVVYELNRTLGGDPLGVVHLAQHIRMHSDIPPEGRLWTVGRLDGVYDHGAMGVSVVRTCTRGSDDRLICETDWTVGFTRNGGFGGDVPPRRRRRRPPDRDCDFRIEQATSPVQAFMYRLHGDRNPLHVDATVAAQSGFSRPILHGLCTLGFVCRAVLRWSSEAYLGAIREFGAEFRHPVHPGDTLVIEGWRIETGLVLRTRTQEGKTVLQNAYVQTLQEEAPLACMEV